MPDVPAQALALRTFVEDGDRVVVSLERVEVPRPGPGQVLVRMEAAPINPSDLGLLFGGADLSTATSTGTADRPALTASLPAPAQRASAARRGLSLPAGNEGAGTVVAAGSPELAERMLGKPVALAGGEMYAQYRCIDANACLVLPDGTDPAVGAASFVNPMTVLGMVETMRSEGHHALVHTAAASNLGQMLVRVCLEDGIPLVNIVRKEEQAQTLRALGAQYVLDSTAPGFMGDLIEALTATSATLAFDAIGGGSLASRILTAMEAAANAGSTYNRYGSDTHKQVYIYGALDSSPTELRRSYGMAWGVGGWLLTPLLQKVGREAVARMRARVLDGLTTTFLSTYTAEISLAEMLDPEVAARYARMATGEKYLVRPSA